MGLPLLALALLALAGGLAYRRRIRDYIGGGRDRIDDDMIRRIEEQGSVEVEEPLDLDEVRLEEERFWSESWDTPEEDW